MARKKPRKRSIKTILRDLGRLEPADVMCSREVLSDLANSKLRIFSVKLEILVENVRWEAFMRLCNSEED